MRYCETKLQNAGHEVACRIYKQDFILDAAASVFGQQRSLFDSSTEKLGHFDAVIMNPPYFKVAKNSPYTRVMRDVVHGQPNIYAFFLACSAQLLRPGGSLVAITPRSFCNGLYFRGFRRWFLGRMSLDRIHLFESRSDTFRDVLQESVITACHRLGRPSPKVVVSTSRGPLFNADSPDRAVEYATVVDDTCGDCVVRIPASDTDLQVLEAIESLGQRFQDVGLRISTGPVVTFRARDYLLPAPNGLKTAPLFNPANVKPFKTVWPLPHKKQAAGFQVCPESMPLLLPARNYVLLRRFTAKEERRRLVASPLLASQMKWPLVALENHLNYVCHSARELSEEETLGLTAIFNSALLDRYFRLLSGNTQVNATEIRTMKFPEMAVVGRIGTSIVKNPKAGSGIIERAVIRELGLPPEVYDRLRDQDELF
jgi:adenine-specific DNA-methyltransferase